jgi:hypothetical protein
LASAVETGRQFGRDGEVGAEQEVVELALVGVADDHSSPPFRTTSQSGADAVPTPFRRAVPELDDPLESGASAPT